MNMNGFTVKIAERSGGTALGPVCDIEVVRDADAAAHRTFITREPIATFWNRAGWEAQSMMELLNAKESVG